jgi:RHH-type proline utilization regulon transcriptional repressor/proline dehydrogenase/delta 1-pyrroline-5-carboxylate dehydrogenase
MPHSATLTEHRAALRALTRAPEGVVLDRLMPLVPDTEARAAITQRAIGFVTHLRRDARPALMEVFLAEYGLSTEEGVALMCLAEAMLRVPDADTMDALIEDKIAPSDWSRHLGQAHSPLVNASTFALYLAGKVLKDKKSIAGVLHSTIKRLGEPVIRQAVRAAMREMGRQFVLGETIGAALTRAAKREANGEAYSYDMLGEAARSDADALRYARSYRDAIAAIGKVQGSGIRTRPGISIKLSALHPRYEPLQHARVMAELVPRVTALARQAAQANIGLNIDAEEADRLDLSLDVIAAVLEDPQLSGWAGFGVVVQAYGKRAAPVIDWLHALAERFDRKIMVRLVKGAYWDTEVKLAQVQGLADYPVFVRKAATDTSYLACATKLMGYRSRIYPQFATHNAHTVAAILNMNVDPQEYEFQRLHGMGEALHDHVRATARTACRIYAPVGAHRDLLAYLVRRLLENGANSSFVNQIVDESVLPARVAADPVADLDRPAPRLPVPAQIFAPRVNSAGWDLACPLGHRALAARLKTLATQDRTTSHSIGSQRHPVFNPATGVQIGTGVRATRAEAEAASAGAVPWDVPAATRRRVLLRAADLFEANADPLFSLLIRDAGKTITDCVSEFREAVDLLRYYADGVTDAPGIGIVSCISPWNFPLAIFSGQIAAALAAGNEVLAKPAEATGLIADMAVGLLYEAGVPQSALILIPGSGAEVGAALTTGPAIRGVAFTGSMPTAQTINRAMAGALPAGTPLIAETGGLNAMIVDSTALPEQAVRDIVAGAFQSAGQRCSALRMLYVQADIAEDLVAMLKGAMDELVVGDPADFATDVGPVIDAAAKTRIDAHIARSRILHSVLAPEGQFVAPTLVSVTGIADLKEEVFGPVCHVATFRSGDLDDVIDAINTKGYGLTFGLHSRIDGRVEHICARVKVGNIYINRNQIGAVVGSQPFGGHGLSGTGPKAGGPRYLARLRARAGAAELSNASAALPGPTGESNRYTVHARGRIACLGPDVAGQMAQVRRAGAIPVEADALSHSELVSLDIEAAVYHGPERREVARALAARDGPIVPLLTDAGFADWLVVERVVSVDTTASGGNAQLLSAMDPAPMA